MLKVTFRNWLRKRYNLDILCDERERAYLYEMPWLAGLVPLGWNLYPVNNESERLKIQRADFNLLRSTALQYGETYIVSEKGRVLTKLKKPLLSPRPMGWERVCVALKRIRDAENSRYVVVVNTGYDVQKSAVITVYKLPRTGIREFINSTLESIGLKVERQLARAVLTED